MGEKILEIEGITKKYKDFKLEPVSFSLEAGRLMSVMGAYGAGKTTLFKLLTGQLRMDEGNVIFFEKGEVLEHCGFVPAEGGFPDCLNAKEISRILDVSESRVSQLHTKALKKMRQKLGGDNMEILGILSV